MLPNARQDKLLLQEIGDELVVYDQERHHIHHLNRTAAVVWRHCDGQTSVAEIARLLQNELNVPVDEEVVWLALDRLEKVHLMKERMTRPPGLVRIGRREIVRRLGRIAAAAFLLPVVTSIVTPTPAFAQSACPSAVVRCTPTATARNTPTQGAPQMGSGTQPQSGKIFRSWV
jgi:hypothetical protein